MMRKTIGKSLAFCRARISIWLGVMVVVVLNGCGSNGEQAPSAKAAKDYLVVASRPNTLYLIELENHRILKRCDIPGNFGMNSMIMAPDTRTAYLISDNSGKIFGIEPDTCKLTFSADLSDGNIRGKSFGSITVSPDGSEVYTVINRSRLLRDEFQPMDPVFAVFNAADGQNAKPVRTFPIARQLTVMATDKQGMVYIAGPDMLKVNPADGEVEVIAKVQNWDRARYGRPDSFAMLPAGEGANEFLTMYTTPIFKDDSQNPETADWVWGYTRVDLESGEVKQADFAPMEVLMFTGVTHPQNSDLLFGVYTQLSKHDLKTRKLIKRVDLDHTYYGLSTSSSGHRIYVGGTASDIGVYDSETLEKITNIELDGDMSTANLRVFAREG